MSDKKPPLDKLNKILMQKIGAGNTSSIQQQILSAYNSGLVGDELNQRISQILRDAGLEDNTNIEDPLPIIIAIVVK